MNVVGFVTPATLQETTISDGLWKQEITLDLEAIKQALNLEKALEGADLTINRFKVQVA
jgi:hypothetical protein